MWTASNRMAGDVHLDEGILETPRRAPGASIAGCALGTGSDTRFTLSSRSSSATDAAPDHRSDHGQIRTTRRDQCRAWRWRMAATCTPDLAPGEEQKNASSE